MRKHLALAAAAAAAPALAPGGSAARAEVPPGIVDIYTDLAYSGSAAAGTGIVLTSSGEVLTNNHVIRGSTPIRVKVVDTGRTYRAKVLGYALGQDVAVIQLQNVTGLTVAPFGSSRGLHVGDTVTAFGNAGGAGAAGSGAEGTIRRVGK